MPADRHTHNVTVFPSRPKQTKAKRPSHSGKLVPPRRRRAPEPGRRPGEDEVAYRVRMVRMHREGKMRRRRAMRRRLMLLCCAAIILMGVVFSFNLLFRVQEFRFDIGETSAYYLPPGAQKISSSSSSAPQSNSVPQSAPSSSAAPQSDSAAQSAPDSSAAQSTPAASQQPPQTEDKTQHRGKPVVRPADTLEGGRYTVQQVLDVLSVVTGTNIFSFNTEEAAQRLEQQLPWLEEVRVLRALPGTVVVRARPAKARYAAQIEEGWAILSDSMKVLEVTAEQPSDLVGADLGECTLEVGRKAVLNCSPDPVDPTQFQQEDKSKEKQQQELEEAQRKALEEAEKRLEERTGALDTLLEQLAANELSEDLTAINIASELELSFVYQDRVTVLLGTTNQLEYKMQFVAEILKNQLSATDKGTLDASNIRDDGSIQPVFSRN